MNFIFPQNYQFKNKLLGVIDYSTAILNIAWDSFIFCSLNLLFQNFTIKLCLLIVLCFPLLLFSIIGFNHENILYVFTYLLKYIHSSKIYLYQKSPYI